MKTDQIIIGIFLILYWLPITITIIIYRIKIKKLYKYKKFDESDKLGFTLIHGLSLFMGFFTFFILYDFKEKCFMNYFVYKDQNEER